MAKQPTKNARAKGKLKKGPAPSERARQVKDHIRRLSLLGITGDSMYSRVVEDFAELGISLVPREVKNYAKHVRAESKNLDRASSDQFTSILSAELLLNIQQARAAGNLAEVRQAIKGLAELLGLEAAKAVDLNLGDPTIDAMLNRYVERVKAGEDIPGCDLSYPCD